MLPPGRTSIRHDALVAVPSLRENHDAVDDVVSVEQLPADLLRYTLPSRYCDSDKLLDFAYQQFGAVPHGLQRVQAICDWVHKNVEYRWGAGSPVTAASDIIAQRFGVCRDFAHTAIALCRTFNLPARYVTGHVPDVAFQDPGTPMDFHAYFEVYIGHKWLTFDARFNVPRIGRIKIACGRDAVDGAFSTVYGAAQLVYFNVWAYQVDPSVVDLGDPIDISKRLDGTPELRFPMRGSLDSHATAA
jgi:transglutaminase-like putative cysteine protease